MSGATVSALRPATVGGSTIAAAAGIDPYKSRAALFLELTGALPAFDGNEATDIGKRVEPVVIDLLRERGYEPLAYPAPEARDPARPWLVGHPDVLLADGYPLVGEVKVTGGWARRSWNGEQPPTTWQAQVQTYLHLCGIERGVIAALIDGTRLDVIEVARDERAIALLLARADEFYGYLCAGECPPFDGSDSERDALHALYPEGEKGRKVRASRDVAEVVNELRLLNEAAEATRRQAEVKRRLIEATMGDAEVMVDAHDVPIVKWTTTTSTRVSAKALRERYPAIHAELAERATTRRFTVV